MPPMHAATSAIIAAVLIVSTTPALAINKCKIDGRTVFQDAPCPDGTGSAITVRPASGYSPPAIAPGPENSAQPSQTAPGAPASTDDMRTRAEALEKERRGREIDHQIKIVEQRLKNLERQQAGELAALSRKKNRAANNLAGAQWETSISQEQQAVMSKYESLMKNERSKIEMLIEQRGRL